MSATERQLWKHLRKLEGIEGRFRRQAPLGPYVADFAHHGAKLVIELDGPFHESDAARSHDADRDAWLTENGFRVLRFRNADVWADTPRVLDAIREAAASPSPHRSSETLRVSGPITPLPQGERGA